MSFRILPNRRGDTPHGAANALDGYFSIKVADDVFGLPVTRVQTIFRIGAVTLAPGGPPRHCRPGQSARTRSSRR